MSFLWSLWRAKENEWGFARPLSALKPSSPSVGAKFGFKSVRLGSDTVLHMLHFWLCPVSSTSIVFHLRGGTSFHNCFDGPLWYKSGNLCHEAILRK